MSNLFSLEKKTAVLTGMTGFFGMYFAEELVSSGAKVIGIGRNQRKIDAIVKKLASRYGADRVTTYCVDQYDIEATQTIYQRILHTEPTIDILVNNANDFSKKTGFNDAAGRLAESSYAHWKAAFDSGIYWAVQSTQHIGVAMQKKGRGSIINVASMYGVVSPHPSLYTGTDKFNPPGYSMAKGGLLQFTKYSAAFLAPNVRVNALSPGSFPNMETATDNALSDSDKQEFLQRLTDRTLLGRVGHPRDLVGGLIYLASDASGYMTGQNLIIDGGWTIT